MESSNKIIKSEWEKKRICASLEESVFCSIHAVGDQDGDDESVDGNDTSHDDGNDGLHDELRAHDGHGSNTSTALGSSVSSSESYIRSYHS